MPTPGAHRQADWVGAWSPAATALRIGQQFLRRRHGLVVKTSHRLLHQNE